MPPPAPAAKGNLKTRSIESYFQIVPKAASDVHDDVEEEGPPKWTREELEEALISNQIGLDERNARVDKERISIPTLSTRKARKVNRGGSKASNARAHHELKHQKDADDIAKGDADDSMSGVAHGQMIDRKRKRGDEDPEENYEGEEMDEPTQEKDSADGVPMTWTRTWSKKFVNPGQEEQIKGRSWDERKMKARTQRIGYTFKRNEDGTMEEVEELVLFQDGITIRPESELTVQSTSQLQYKARKQKKLQKPLLSHHKQGVDSATEHSGFDDTLTQSLTHDSATVTPSSNSNDRLIAKERCYDSIISYLKIVRSSKWTYNKDPLVITELNSKSDEEIASEIIKGWHESLFSLAVYGWGWQETDPTIFPLARGCGTIGGLYIDFLKVPATHLHGVSYKAYIGMACGTHGLENRIKDHQTQRFRNAHPSFHYLMMDTPGVESDFRAVCLLPQSSRGIILLEEGHLIAILGGWENKGFLSLMSTLDMPAVEGERRKPVVGLNREPGLRLDGWDLAGARVARESKSQAKAMRLITRGELVSVRASPTQGNIRFALLHAHWIKIDAATRKQYPQLQRHHDAYAFVDLSFGAPHENAYFNIDLEDKEKRDKYRQFAVWLHLEGDSGFWLHAEHEFEVNWRTYQDGKVDKMTPAAEALRAKQKAKRVERHTAFAQMIIQVYSMD